jgi:signal peptidase I
MAAKTAKPARRKGLVANALELIVTVAVAVGLALLIQAFLVKPYRIPSGSMIPTLEIGQRILVNRLDTSPGLYDVVVFHPPAGADPGVAICGDSKQGPESAATNGSNPIAAQPCDEPTAQESAQTFVKRVVGLPGDHLLIKSGHVYLNGVEEKGSYVQPCTVPQDCTFRESIKVPAGDYYMMGDNRGESDDSRYWGPVPQKWIIGVAFATYWPIDRIGFF